MNQLSGSVVNGRYRIINTLGIGGMSVVFRAYDLQENREVSLKVLRADRLGDRESRRRFYNESRAVALMSHPNIVNVYDVNFEGKIQYIVMEYVDGVTLKDRMDQKGKLSCAEAIHYLKQILGALSHAHSRGVVHHDIKPQNILLLEDATIKVTDFGIASVPNFETDTSSDETVGSVHYISPEQALGDVTDEKSDLYSVGVMMYAMLTGRLPFDAESPTDVARMQVEKPPYPPCKLVEDLPIGFQQVIFRAMAKQPSHRYQNADSMLADLEALEANPKKVFPYPKEFSIARRKKPVQKGIAGFFRALFPEDEEIYRHSRNRILAVASAVLLSFLVVFIGVLVMVGVVSDLYKEYVSVPSYVGMAYEDVQLNAELAEKFNFDIQYEYDNSVEEGIVIEQDPMSGDSVPSGSTLKLVISKGGRDISVPDVVGKTYSDASAMLRNDGLSCTVKYVAENPSIPENQVLRTDPVAGTSLTEGASVILYVNVHATVTEVIMPNVVGKTKETAVAALQQRGLDRVVLHEAYSNTVPAGTVISQSIAADTTVSVSNSVSLVISKGAEGVGE